MKKKMNKKGFTLAELLIVVAIIAVLVAIAIPVFTSQLEKSKEATDISNIRSYYAEITTGLLTGDMKKADDSVIVGNNMSAVLTTEDGLPSESGKTFDVEINNFKFQQGQNSWQTADFEVAGIAKGSVSEYTSGANTVTYTFVLAQDGDYVLKSVGIAEK